MTYDFDKIIDRRNTGSLKWDVGNGEIPLWVADMDFEVAPAIKKAIKDRAEHGVFGYNDVTDDWYEAIISWWKRRYGVIIPRNNLAFATGVVPVISSAVRKLTAPNEKVILLTPVYNIFFNSVRNSGRRVLQIPLIYEKGTYRLNIEQLEKGFADKETTLCILCNPHNPVGRIWTEEELAEIGRLSRKYSVTVISDEIHCDITSNNKKYVPYAFVSDDCADNSITCISATKAFNFAGLQCAAVYSRNDKLFARVNRAINTDEVAEPNSFAVAATVAAFRDGEEWLTQMCAYISGNKRFVHEFFLKNVPSVKMTESDATYLCWLDCRKLINDNRELFGDSAELAEYIRGKTGVYLSDGVQFGYGGEDFLRLNAACPRSLLAEALDRLKGLFG